MEKNEFEEIIIKTIESLPDKFKKKLKNIDITIEDKETRYYMKSKNSVNNNKLTLGLYQGLPLTKQAGKRRVMPDKITIYKKSIEAVSRSREELKKNIRRVVLHEIGHYFGLDEKKLKNLGF